MRVEPLVRGPFAPVDRPRKLQPSAVGSHRPLLTWFGSEAFGSHEPFDTPLYEELSAHLLPVGKLPASLCSRLPPDTILRLSSLAITTNA